MKKCDLSSVQEDLLVFFYNGFVYCEAKELSPNKIGKRTLSRLIEEGLVTEERKITELGRNYVELIIKESTDGKH